MERALRGHGVGVQVGAGVELKNTEIEGPASFVDRRAEGGCGVRDLVELRMAATLGARLARGVHRFGLDAREQGAHAALEAAELARHEARPGLLERAGAARERFAGDARVVDVLAAAAEVFETAAGSEIDADEREQLAYARLLARKDGLGVALVLVRQALGKRRGIGDRAAEGGR